MKKGYVIKTFIILSLSLIFTLTATSAKAGEQPDIKKSIMLMLNSNAFLQNETRYRTSNGNGQQTSDTKQISIPLDNGVSAFVDCTATRIQSKGPDEKSSDLRAVIGFNFPLQ